MGKVHRLKPTRADAEKAVRTLIAWAGDDPDREGLRETPGRVTRAFPPRWGVSFGKLDRPIIRAARRGRPFARREPTRQHPQSLLLDQGQWTVELA